MTVREIKITDDEAAKVGVVAETLDWGPKIRPLLIAKGVPVDYLNIGDPRCVVIRREADGTIFGVREPGENP
jgi:hypothetical protein